MEYIRVCWPTCIYISIIIHIFIHRYLKQVKLEFILLCLFLFVISQHREEQGCVPWAMDRKGVCSVVSFSQLGSYHLPATVFSWAESSPPTLSCISTLGSNISGSWEVQDQDAGWHVGCLGRDCFLVLVSWLGGRATNLSSFILMPPTLIYHHSTVLAFFNLKVFQKKISIFNWV